MAEPKEYGNRSENRDVSNQGEDDTVADESTEDEDLSNAASSSSIVGAGSNLLRGILASLLFSNPQGNYVQVRNSVRVVSGRYRYFSVFLIAFKGQGARVVQHTLSSTPHIAIEQTVTVSHSVSRTRATFPLIAIVKLRLQSIAGIWRVKFAIPSCLGGLLVLKNIWDFLSGCWVWTHRDPIIVAANFLKNHPQLARTIWIIGFRLWTFYATCLGLPALIVNILQALWDFVQYLGFHHLLGPASVWLLAYNARPVFRRSVTLRSAALEDSVNQIGLFQLLPARPPTTIVFRHRVATLRIATLADAQHRVGLLVGLPAAPRIMCRNRPAAQVL